MVKEIGPSLKPQDVGVLLKIVSLGDKDWTQQAIAKELGMPLSSINQSLQRATLCSLYNPRRKAVLAEALFEFLSHGIRFVFPAPRGKILRGIPTAAGAAPLNKEMDAEALRWPPVWASKIGTQQGYALAPLIPVIDEVPNYLEFYELLALTDALREGRVRETQIATKELSAKILRYKDSMNAKRRRSGSVGDVQ
jgi:hypothetical protein